MSDGILSAVRTLYERHPYPSYPLLARPRWQDGYLTHSGFARALSGQGGGSETSGKAGVLIGGAGEILPYIVRRWESAGQRIVSVDLSRASLRRARFRLLGMRGPTAFVQGDLGAFLAKVTPKSFMHIDLFGVLHHMASPRTAIASVGRALAPGGTARVMVYNSPARSWIWQLQRAFASLGLSPISTKDLEVARRLLTKVAAGSPALTARLAQVGNATLASNARFADLFLHPREARISPEHWYEWCAEAGLEVTGILDRYGELDDLPNPLWQSPSAKTLGPRIQDRRFEGNLELLLVKPPRSRDRRVSTRRMPTLSTGPTIWWSFPETDAVPRGLRRRIFAAHRAFVRGSGGRLTDADVATLTPPEIGRLARLGAILPNQLPPSRVAEAICPLATRMDPPSREAPPAALGEDVVSLVRQLLGARATPRRLKALLARLTAARS